VADRIAAQHAAPPPPRVVLVRRGVSPVAVAHQTRERIVITEFWKRRRARKLSDWLDWQHKQAEQRRDEQRKAQQDAGAPLAESDYDYWNGYAHALQSVRNYVM
jgi:hypothetical protein